MYVSDQCGTVLGRRQQQSKGKLGTNRVAAVNTNTATVGSRQVPVSQVVPVSNDWAAGEELATQSESLPFVWMVKERQSSVFQANLWESG